MTVSESRNQHTFRRRLRALVIASSLTVVGVGIGFILGVGAAIVTIIATDSTLTAFVAAETIPPGVVIAVVVVTELVYLCVGSVYLHRWLGGVRTKIHVPTRGELDLAARGVVVTLAVALVVFGTAPIDGWAAITGLGGALTANPVLALVIGGLSVVLVAPAEELLFRGAIQGRLRRTFGPVVSILAASVLFTAAHLIGRSGSFVPVVTSLAVIFSVSLILGFVYERTENLTTSILVHGLYNAVLLSISYVLII